MASAVVIYKFYKTCLTSLVYSLEELASRTCLFFSGGMQAKCTIRRGLTLSTVGSGRPSSL